MWRPNRALLVLVGLVLILLSAGLVFLDIRRAGEEVGTPPVKGHDHGTDHPEHEAGERRPRVHGRRG